MEFLLDIMKLYERLLKIVEFFEENSQTKLAKRIGISQTTFWGYLNHTGQSKVRLDLLNKILIVYPQINRDWLYFGEGEMLTTDSVPTAQQFTPSKIASVPVLGFASCGVIGWSGEMTIPMSATAPHVGPQTIAVMASGESMIPAGIGHGHICFCEPDLEPLRGDIVYVRRHDELGTLKTFLGWGLAAGVPEATKGELCLRGWTDRDEKGQQQEIVLTVDTALVKTVAPVVFVRRRM